MVFLSHYVFRKILTMWQLNSLIILFFFVLPISILLKYKQLTCWRNDIWGYLFNINNITIFVYLGYLITVLSNRFYEIKKNLIHILIFWPEYLKNGPKTIQHYWTVSRNNRSIIRVILTIHLIFSIMYLHDSEKHNDTKHYISNINTLNTFFIKLPLFTYDVLLCVGVECNNDVISQGRSYENDNINISHCFFSRINSFSFDGGVLYVNGGTYTMIIRNSMFYNCICSQYGGAIYFASSNSSSLRMVCANRCSCGLSNYGPFAYISASQTNHVEYLSASFCSHTFSGYRSFWIQSGNQRVDSTNSSMNYVFQVSSIYIQSPSSFSSSFCTFSNNQASSNICIYIYSTSGTLLISYSNIVHNNSPTNYGVVSVYGSGGSKNMMFCIFQNNSNRLFYINSGSLEVSHSFIEHSSSFSSLTPVSTAINNSFMKRETYHIQFYNSLHCNTDFPEQTLVQSLMRSFEETIRPTNEETLKNTFESTKGQTKKATLNVTPYRSHDNLCTNHLIDKGEINVIYSICFLLIN